MTELNSNQFENTPQLLLFDSIRRILFKDSREALANLSLNDSQFGRRNLVRAVFTLIEGLTFGLKNWALTHPENEISVAESLLLSEITYDLKENGNVREISTRLGTLPNIRFAFKAVSKAEGIENPLDTSSSGWEALDKAMKIRHRLTHPKSTATLVVSDEELATVLDAQEFYLAASLEIFSRSSTKLRERAEKAETALASAIEYASQFLPSDESS